VSRRSRKRRERIGLCQSDRRQSGKLIEDSILAYQAAEDEDVSDLCRSSRLVRRGKVPALEEHSHQSGW
jgi:hypothetical protein